MVLHNTITMILITLNPKDSFAFLDFLRGTILQLLKMGNAVHARQGNTADSIKRMLRIIVAVAK